MRISQFEEVERIRLLLAVCGCVCVCAFGASEERVILKFEWVY